MDFLEESFGAETSPVDLHDLVGTNLPEIKLPQGAIRNRAASTALVASEPGKALDNYQLLMRESEDGSEDYLNTLNKGSTSSLFNNDIKGVMEVLSDANVPFEKKEEIVKSMRDSMFLKDTAVALHSNSLSAKSAGENVEQEAVRLSSADAIRQIYKARGEVQGIVNAYAASLDPVSANTFVGALAVLVAPFGNAVDAGALNAKIAEAEGKPLKMWDIVKGYILGGSSVMDRRKALENLPPEKRVEYAQAVIKGIQSNKNIIFSSDNQFANFQRTVNIFEEGGYTTFDEWLDNLSPILDVIGLGQLIRGARKVERVAKTPIQEIKGVPAIAKTEPVAAVSKIKPKLVEKEDLAKVTELPSKGQFDETIEIAEKERDVVTVDLMNSPKDKTLAKRLDKLDEYIAKLQEANKPELLKKTPLADLVSRIEINSIIRQENPSAPGNIIMSANPEQGRNLFKAAVEASDEQVAEALFGTNKAQVVINNTFPQVATPSGAVTAKVTGLDRSLKSGLAEKLDAVSRETGAPYFTSRELDVAKANVTNDFRNAEGLTVNDAMSTFAVDGGQIKIGAVYGTTEGGFLKASDAVEQAKFALRHHGIRDDEIKLMKKSGLDYVPTTLADEAGKEGDYVVKVETTHDIDPTDITSLDKLNVKRNWADRIAPLVSQNKGSASRYMFDAASMLHPIYTGAASVVSDATAKFDKLLLNIASEFSNMYVKLKADRKAVLDSYIREANHTGLKFDPVDLALNRGFSNNEIDIIKKWREFWDGHFYLENADIVKSLNAQGYGLFKNQNTELYAKPIPKNQNIGWFYDPSVDDVVRWGRGEGDILYAAGGTYAKLRRPITVNGIEVEHMVVRNTPTEYLSKFRNSDQVLNYREGYFQIQYQAPKFVIDTVSGKAVAVAGDTAEAKFFANRMNTQAGATDQYVVRGDIRELQQQADAWWDVNSASGRIAQRHRGKLLEDARGLNHLGDGSYILDPVDSAVRAAKSIAGRTVARPMLEAAKARFIQQYGDMLPSNGHGGKDWPKSVDVISAPGKETQKAISDARTTYEYINYLENGYMNSIDQVFKWTFNSVANVLGSLGLSKAERSAMWMSDHSPTGWGKNTVFMSYIGTNIFRQWIIQPHQALRTIAYNPKLWASGRHVAVPADYVQGKLSGKYMMAETKGFADFIDASGLLDAVDKSNLVRGTLLEASENSGNILYRGGKTVTDTTRKLGFDLGEQANLLMHAMAVYDKRMKAGQNLADKNVRAEAFSEIRAISYDMNFAGDMPYNQTSPSLILQFMQVPHKAFLQMTNRRIDPAIRMRLAVADAIMWGGPTALVAEMLGADILPENPFWKETILWGAESAMLNKLFSWMSGERVNVDFSSLAPYELTGWSKFFEAMYTGGMEQMIANSPSGQLLLKDGGRVRNVIKKMSRFFGIVEDSDEMPEDFLSVMNEILKISSGWNNGVKAKLLLDASKRLDQYGNKIDSNVHSIEAWSQALGFGSGDTRDLYRTTMEWAKDTKKHREDVLQVYQDIKRYYAEKLEVEANDVEFITKVTGRVMKVFEKDPIALSIIKNEWARDMVGKDQALLQLFMKRVQIPETGNLIDEIKQAPLSEEEKAKMIQILNDVAAARLPDGE